MKYKITIEKIDNKLVKSRQWVEVDPYKNNEGKEFKYDYRDMETYQDISETIYTQTREDNINLVDIIDSFNKF